MLVLFDQGTPVPIRASLKNHTVKTAAQQGWSTLRNSDLLNAAEAEGFELLLTTDKNLAYQQNLAGRRIAVVVLGNSQWPIVERYLDKVVAAVDAAHVLAAILKWIFHMARSFRKQAGKTRVWRQEPH